MTMASVALPGRGFIAVSGPDARTFLQGLVTNNLEHLSPHRMIYAALLSPQGKFLHDFILSQDGETLWIDCEAARRDDLLKRFSMYRLRANVTLQPAERSVHAVIGDIDPSLFAAREAGATVRVSEELLAGADPRHAGLGVRLYGAPAAAETWLAAQGIAPGAAEDYELLRLSLGIPDGSRDMIPERSLAIEYGLEDLHGVDFAKGCYVGQEVMARAKHRGTLRKFIHQVSGDATLPEAGTPIMLADKEAGEMRSSLGSMGLALLRFEMVEEALATNAPLLAAGIALRAQLPVWTRETA